jgi:hypothetical protein
LFGGIAAIGLGNIYEAGHGWRLLRFELAVVGDFAVRTQNHLAEVAEDGSFARGDAVLGDGEEDFAEDAVDVFGRIEITGRCGQFRSERLVDGGLGSGLRDVDKAVVRVGRADRLRAAPPRRGEMGAAVMSEITNGIEEIHFVLGILRVES